MAIEGSLNINQECEETHTFLFDIIQELQEVAKYESVLSIVHQTNIINEFSRFEFIGSCSTGYSTTRFNIIHATEEEPKQKIIKRSFV